MVPARLARNKLAESRLGGKFFAAPCADRPRKTGPNRHGRSTRDSGGTVWPLSQDPWAAVQAWQLPSVTAPIRLIGEGRCGETSRCNWGGQQAFQAPAVGGRQPVLDQTPLFAEEPLEGHQQHQGAHQ